MERTNWRRKWIRTAVAASSAGMLFASSCSTDQLQAVAAGLDVVFASLNDTDDNITFGDWLLSELQD